ncbi:sensor histidine kinase [Salinifilum ghardaiensis]
MFRHPRSEPPAPRGSAPGESAPGQESAPHEAAGATAPRSGRGRTPAAPSARPGLGWLVALLREQWIFAALLGLTWCGDVLLLVSGGSAQLVIVPELTALAVLALLARRAPVTCGLAGAVVLGGATLLARAGLLPEPEAFGPLPVLLGTRPTENLAGLLLVLALYRGAPLSRALPVTAALVLAALGAVGLRGATGFGIDPLWLGFLQLILAAGTGLYLRSAFSGQSAFAVLLRQQWPVIAALCILLFLQVASVEAGPYTVLTQLLGCAVMGLFAVLAPTRPIEASVLAAAALVTMVVLLRLLGEPTTGLLGPVPATAVGAGMVLVAITVRTVERALAARVVAGLVLVALLALFGLPGRSNYLDPRVAATPLFLGGLLLVTAIGTGMYFRSRDADRARSVEAAISLAQQNERMALARELHDIVAHHVTGIVVQAQAARMVAERDAAAAGQALDRIADSGTEALTAMRRIVAGMREEGAGESASTDLDSDVRALVDSTLGPQVRPRVSLGTELGETVPQEVARSALRVVQEALTNAEKHAADVTHIDVHLRTDGNDLRIRVRDDGAGQRRQPAGGSGGYGLVGMRERVELLGGTFEAGPAEDAGWRVDAVMPLTEKDGNRGS